MRSYLLHWTNSTEDELESMEFKNRLDHIIHCLVEFRKWWILPAIVGLVLATVYAFFLQGETWTSRQTMIIRDDLLGENFKPGSFINEEAMKSAQETVLETARRPEVIRKALEILGPETKSFLGFGGAIGEWPSAQMVEDYRSAVSFESANGGEFGKSEVIVLATKGSSSERSIAFLTILLEQVDEKLAEIRADRFESMESEVRATLESTLESRAELEADVIRMDNELGPDIHLVRTLNEKGGGSPSAFENELGEISRAKRVASSMLDQKRSIRQSLLDAKNSSSVEVPTSAELLTSQRGLSELVNSLAKAKQDLSAAEARFQPAHHSVKSGRENVAVIKRQLKQSLGTAIRGLDNEIVIFENRVVALDQLMEKSEIRLANVSKTRAPYARKTRELDKVNDDYSEATARLARMRSRKMASSSIKLLTRIGEPYIGTKPDGLGRRAMSLIGAIAGLMIGLGLVMMMAPPFVEPNLMAANAPQPTVQPDVPPVPDTEPEVPSEPSGEHRLAQIVPQRSGAIVEPVAEAPQPEPVAEVPQPEPVAETHQPVPVEVHQPEHVEAYQPEPVEAYQPEHVETYQTPEPAPEYDSYNSYQTDSYQTESYQYEDSTQQELVVDREVVPQTPQPEVPNLVDTSTPQTPDVEPVADSNVGITAEEPPATPLQTVSSFYPSSPVQDSFSVAGALMGASSEETPDEPQPQPEPQQNDDSQTPPVVIVSDSETPEPPEIEAYRAPVEPVPVEPHTPFRKPANSSTIAAIFANMPQPIVDVPQSVADDQTPDVPEPPAPETPRESPQTIQLNGGVAMGSTIPLQRRTNARPIELAKTDEEEGTSQDSIDNVFSNLTPPEITPDVTQQRPELPSDFDLSVDS